MNKKLARSVLSYALLLWLLIVITAYFVVQKPWPQSGSPAALRSFLDLVLAGLIFMAAAGLGSRCIGSKPGLHPLELASLQVGFGLGLTSLIILAIGSAGFIGPLSGWLLLGLVVISHWRLSLSWLRNFFAGISQFQSPNSAVAKVSLAVSGLLLAISLLVAMAPPLKWDSLVYHLALPQRYLELGRVGFVSGNLFTGFPQLAEMNFTWAMAMGSGKTAAIVGWMTGASAVLGLAGLAQRKLGGIGLWLAPAVVLAGASLWQGLAWAYVDHWVFLYGLLLFISLDRYEDTGKRAWLWTAGASLGFAISSKYTGALLAAAAVLWLALIRVETARAGVKTAKGAGEAASPEDLNIGSWFKDSAMILLVAFVIFSPWLIKNWLTTGNPLYPFLFPGREIDSLRQTFHAQGQSILQPGGIAFLPWLVSILGVEGGEGFSSSIGPFYLALIPGLLLAVVDNKEAVAPIVKRLGAVAIVGWLLWGIGGTLADPLSQTRLYYGFFPALALLAVAGYQRLRSLRLSELQLGWVISRLVIFGMLLVGMDGFFHFVKRDPLPLIAGQQSQNAYLADQLGWYGPAMAYMEELPADSRVELLWEARSYYCRRPCQPDEILDKWWYWRRTLGSGQRIAESLRNQGVSHILIYDFGAEFEKRTQDLQEQEDWLELEAFRHNELELVQSFGDGYSLYSWSDVE